MPLAAPVIFSSPRTVVHHPGSCRHFVFQSN
uniref:Uncharacterized protein n=1 Tax=Anopheles quadriannulatus TaxID=34691 RepID=A0A182XTX6_ANOQN